MATLALIVILFDGGMSIGMRRFRAAAVPIAILGVVGTFVTFALVGRGGPLPARVRLDGGAS